MVCCFLGENRHALLHDIDHAQFSRGRLAAQETTLSFVLGSGSKWKQEHLNRLGVDFKMNEEFDICKFVFDSKTTLEWNRTYANSQSTFPRS